MSAYISWMFSTGRWQLIIKAVIILSIPVLGVIADSNRTIQWNTAVNRSLTQRIVGGTSAIAREFPSFVWALGGCGGTLIAPDIVLTAAHCSEAFQNGQVKIGILRRNSGRKYAVESVIVHPDYKPSKNSNDIAIVKLACASRAPLQVLNFNNSNPIGKMPLVAIGFGYTVESIFAEPSDVLQKVTMEHVPTRTCKKQYSGQYTVYGNLMICAGVQGGGKDTCGGDSGGPLYTVDKIQVGITSWGIGCGDLNYSGVSTRVSKYKSFIEEMIAEYSDPIPQYCQ
jgi:trypsin